MTYHHGPARPIVRTSLAILLLVVLHAVRADSAEPAGDAQSRIAQTRAELNSDDATVRRTAIASLIHSDISAQMLAEMRAALNDADGQVRSTAATAVGNLGAEAAPAIPQLIAQLQGDSAKEARETAARALGRIGKAAPDERRAIEPLQTASKEDADSVTRVVALGALAMMDVELESQIGALRGYLGHDDALTRMKASHALGMIGLPAKAAAPQIVRVLELETDSHRRGYVARALGNVGNPASLPALYATLQRESDAGAQGEMRGAIARLGGKAPE